MELLFALLLGLGAAAEPPAPDPDANVAMADVRELQRIVKAHGLPATLDESDPEGPVFVSHIGETEFVIILYGCEAALGCRALEFAAGYDLPEGMDWLALNDWNRDTRFGGLYLDDEGDPILTMDVNLAGDGIGPKNFGDWLDIWAALVEDFEAHIDDTLQSGPHLELEDAPAPRKVYEISWKGNFDALLIHP